MTITLASLEAIPLSANFATIYGGAHNIPAEISRPAAHFQTIPRTGQFCTLVRAQSSDGAAGTGECFGLPTPYATAEIVNRVIAPALVGRQLAAPGSMLSALGAFFATLGHTRGPSMEAMSGVDIALWDLEARRAGAPLAMHLGARVAPVPTYVSPVPFLPSPDRTARMAKALAEDFPAVKLKIGREVSEDLAFITAVREALPPHVELMLDANCAYSFEQARDLVAEIAGLDIAWLEEPLAPEDTAGLRRLAEISTTPLAGGENEFTPAALGRLATEAGIGILQPNISRVGGVTAMLAVDALARRHGARVAPHGVGGSVAMASTLHVATAMDRFLCFEVNRMPNPLRDQLGAPIAVIQGKGLPPEGPGHGVVIAHEALARFTEGAIHPA